MTPHRLVAALALGLAFGACADSAPAGPDCPERFVCLENWGEGRPFAPFEDDEFRVEVQIPASELPAADDVVTSLDAEVVVELERWLNPARFREEGSFQPLSGSSSRVFDIDVDQDGRNDFLVERLSGEIRVSERVPAGGEQYVLETGVMLSDDAGMPTELARHPLCYVVPSLDRDAGRDLVCRGVGGARWGVLWSIDGFDDGPTSATPIPVPTDGHVVAVTAADFDEDGDADLFFAVTDQRNRVYRNDDRTFVEVTDICGITEAEKLTFYVCPAPYDPTEANAPLAVLIDNDLMFSNAESYVVSDGRFEAYERVPVEADVVSQADVGKAAGAPASRAQFEGFVDTMRGMRLMSTTPRGNLIRGHDASPDVRKDDMFNPMAVVFFSLGPHWFETKAQTGLPVGSSTMHFESETRSWLPFQPYELDGGRSSGGYWQEAWGTVRVPTGAPFPVLLFTHGRHADESAADLPTIADRLLRPFGFDMEGFTESYGHSIQTAYTFDERGRMVPVDIGVDMAGEYKTVQLAWRHYDWDDEPTVYLLLGGMGGYIRALRIPPQGNVARIALEGAGEATNPNGCGSTMYVRFGERTVARMACWEVTQHLIGSPWVVVDQSVGEQQTVEIIVDWRTNGERRIERWVDVPADRHVQTLVEGTGERLDDLPEFWPAP